MDSGVIRLVAGDVQLLERIEDAPKPAWGIALELGVQRTTAQQRLRRLWRKELVCRAYWHGATAWWALTEQGREALKSERAIAANNRRSSPEAV